MIAIWAMITDCKWHLNLFYIFGLLIGFISEEMFDATLFEFGLKKRIKSTFPLFNYIFSKGSYSFFSV